MPARFHPKNITWIIQVVIIKPLWDRVPLLFCFYLLDSWGPPSQKKANELPQGHQLLVPNLDVQWLSIKRKQAKKGFQILFEKLEHLVMGILFLPSPSNNQLKQSRGAHFRLA